MASARPSEWSRRFPERQPYDVVDPRRPQRHHAELLVLSRSSQPRPRA